MKEEKMSVINMAKDIKKVHPDFIICYKVGAFIQVFGKDAYIISYIFNYNIKKTKEDIATCGFPKQIIPRICAKLEQRKNIKAKKLALVKPITCRRLTISDMVRNSAANLFKAPKVQEVQVKASS